ncbi:hypothetical protein [Streptomyces sp. NPDC005784]|uniref:hypothetical protein n=1 Tax=Streptomyces sp. NPDC005784 TaxID=3364731 RepID=UPI0036BFAB37
MHELLTGLPHLGEDDRLRVDALRVLVYDHVSALPLARVSQMVRITLLNVATEVPTRDPACADIA